MEWNPSDKMTTEDLRAVLMSWGVATISSDKKVLLAEVALHYKAIMQEWASRSPARTVVLAGHGGLATAAAVAAASASACDDKSVGTDGPQAEISYIGSDEQRDHNDPDEEEDPDQPPRSIFDAPPGFHRAAFYDTDGKRIRAPRASSAAAAATPEGEEWQVDEDGNVIGKKDETRNASPSDAAEDLSALVVRPAALEEATPKRKAKAKGTKKPTAKDKLYGYLPMGGVFIDEDQRKDGDKDAGSSLDHAV